MSRLHLQFGCGKYKLAGTLDTAPGSSGLLIVSGGNELRSGAFSGQSHLAQQISKKGFPVFRFDRRGIGDSEGENRGFRKSRKDILSAIEAFRAMCPQMNRLVAFGNCDAASALMLMNADGCDALVLSNPWTYEDGADGEAADDLPPPDAIRSRYIEKLRNPAELKRLVTGGVDFRKLLKGLTASMSAAPEASSLAQEMKQGLDAATKPYTILLAEDDRTAQAFDVVWDDRQGLIRRCPNSSHAYVEPHAREWLEDQIIDMLRG